MRAVPAKPIVTFSDDSSSDADILLSLPPYGNADFSGLCTLRNRINQPSMQKQGVDTWPWDLRLQSDTSTSKLSLSLSVYIVPRWRNSPWLSHSCNEPTVFFISNSWYAWAVQCAEICAEFPTRGHAWRKTRKWKWKCCVCSTIETLQSSHVSSLDSILTSPWIPMRFATDPPGFSCILFWIPFEP